MKAVDLEGGLATMLDVGGEYKAIIGGPPLPRENRRMLTLVVVTRLLIILSVVLALWSVAEHFWFGTSDTMMLQQIIASLALALACHIILILRRRVGHGRLGVALVIAVSIAIIGAEANPEAIVSSSSMVMLTVPIVIAAAVVSSRAALVSWLFVSVLAGGCSMVCVGYLPFYPLTALFFVAFVVHLTVARLDHVIAQIEGEKALLDDIVDVVTTYEEQRVETLTWQMERMEEQAEANGKTVTGWTG